MRAGGALLVAEMLLDEGGTSPPEVLLQSLNMLAQTHGRERSLSQYRALLESLGFSNVQGKKTGGTERRGEKQGKGEGRGGRRGKKGGGKPQTLNPCAGTWLAGAACCTFTSQRCVQCCDGRLKGGVPCGGAEAMPEQQGSMGWYQRPADGGGGCLELVHTSAQSV